MTETTLHMFVTEEIKPPHSVPLERRGSVSNRLLSGGRFCPCYHLSVAFLTSQCPYNVVHSKLGYDIEITNKTLTLKDSGF